MDFSRDQTSSALAGFSVSNDKIGILKKGLLTILPSPVILANLNILVNANLFRKRCPLKSCEKKNDNLLYYLLLNAGFSVLTSGPDAEWRFL